MYETFEHTADVGIRVRADDLDALFVDAARALFSIIVENPDAVAPKQQLTLSVHADDREELLHNWLAELLYIFHTQRLVLTEFHVDVHPPVLTATVRGEPIDVSRHLLDAEVKAVT
ncbi:MAG: archease, partial [Planctomycetaceae bacterium]|nr:archease [Planctomycetaceae bacterium]